MRQKAVIVLITLLLPPMVEAAIVGEDDRIERDPSISGSDIEAAQARIWCHKRGPKPKGNRINKNDISPETFSVSNATLAFEDGMAIVNRHIFVDKKGKKKADFNDCSIEHIKSGEIFRVTDGAFPKMAIGATEFHHQDFAVVKLSGVPSGGVPVPREDIAISEGISTSDHLKVVSNVAGKNGKVEALTLTSCSSFGRYKVNGARVPVHGTDCDTGDGSSGAQVYIDRGGPKFAGVISGDVIKIPEGGEFDAAKLSTIVSEFDQSLIDSYETLKARRLLPHLLES